MSNITVNVTDPNTSGTLNISSVVDGATVTTSSTTSTANLTITAGGGGGGSGADVAIAAGDGIAINETNGTATISSTVTGGATNLTGLSDVTFSSASSGQLLSYNGSAWTAADAESIPGNLSDLTNVDASSPSSGQVLEYNGSQWVASDNDPGAQNLSGLSDVTLSSPSTGEVLAYNGTQWVATADSSLTLASSDPSDLGTTAAGSSSDAARADHVHNLPSLTSLTDVDATTPSTGQVLAYNGTQWVATADSALTLSSTDAVDLGTAAAGSSSDAARADHVHESPNLSELADVDASSPSSGQVLSYNGSQWVAAADSALGLSSSAGADLGTAAAGTSGDASRADHVHNLPSLTSLTDVDASSPSSGQVLSYNGSQWVAAADSALGLSSASAADLGTAAAGSSGDAARADHVHNTPNLTQLGDVDVSSPSTGQVLSYNGTQWVSSSDNALTLTSTAPSDDGTAAAGTSSEAARADHVHNLPSLTLTSLTDVSSSSPSSGQLLSYNGTAWAPIDSPAGFSLSSSAGADLGTGAAGSSSDAARADHVHDLPTFDEITNGTATTSGSLTLDPSTGAVIVQGGQSTEGSITLNCQQNSHGVTIQSPPHSAGASYTLTLPSTTGTQGQVLTTSGSGGVLSWSTTTSSGLTFVEAPTSSDSDGTVGDLSFDDNYFYIKTAAGWRRASLIGWGVSIVITTHPSSSTAAAGSSVTLTAAAQTTNGGPVDYQWQSSVSGSDFVSITGAESSTYTVSVSSAISDLTYRCMIIASGATTAYTETASITLEASSANLLLIESGDHLHTASGQGLLHSGPGSSIIITSQPTDQTLSGSSLTMSVAAYTTGSGNVTYQWQESQNGGSYFYSITQGTQSSYTIQSQNVVDGFKYRVVISAPGSSELVSDVIETSVPSTSIDSTIYNVSHLGDAGNDVDCLVMSNDGSTVVAYRTLSDDIVIYRQSGSDFVQDDVIDINESTVTGSEVSTTKNAVLSISDDGDIFAICMPEAANPQLNNVATYGSIAMPLGRIRAYQRDSSGEWSQLGNDIDGTINLNTMYQYGGDYVSFPLSEVAINQDGTKLFALTSGESSYGLKSRLDVYEFVQGGWDKQKTIEAGGTQYSHTTESWQGLRCTADGKAVAYASLIQTSDAGEGTGNTAKLFTHQISATSWENATASTYTTDFDFDDPSTDSYWRASRYRYKFSRDLMRVVMSNHTHDRTGFLNTGLVIVAGRSSMSGSFAQSSSMYGLTAYSRIFGISADDDGSAFLIWQAVSNTSTIAKYNLQGTSLTGYSPTSLAATAAAMNGSGSRIAYWTNSSNTLRVIE
jgi:hypothetical protein